MALAAVKQNRPPAQSIKLLTLPQLMTPAQCAEYLQVRPATLYVWVHQRRIPYRKVGGALRFDVNEVVEWTKGEKDCKES